MAASWRDRAEDQPFFTYMNFGVTHESGVFRSLGSWPNSVIHLVMQVVRKWKGHEMHNRKGRRLE